VLLHGVEVDLVAGASVGSLKVGREVMAQLFPGGEGVLGWVHEPQLGRVGQGHREVVGHDSLIPSCSEDGGGVDMQELGGVDTPIIFLRQVELELVWPYHHSEVWSKRHATTPRSWGCRGASSLPHWCGIRRTKVIIELAAPLSVVLNGDVATLTRVAALEFSP
jgi:hypothetical protein